ncbi:MAG: site-2 protease family protein, partial [Bacilli bacterium]|nr:site-2 protease family protein [Bacilli bacterium]
MPWYYIPLYILIIVIILGVLVSIHEAGHLLAAKIFNVYCFEYSIGFGPAFLHKKRKGGETYFSLRAFPLGGYVSMYGEPGEMPEGMEEPGPNRSLAEIAKWKKGIILLAGVTMNFVLGLVLIYVKDVAFPSYYFAYGGAIKSVTAEGTSKAMEVDALPAAYTGEILSYIDSQKEAELNANDYWIALPQYAYSDTAVYYIVDDDVEVFKADGTAYFSSAIHYVAAYYPSTLTEDHSLSGSIKLFPQTEKLAPVELQGVGIKHLPDVELDALGHDKALEITEPGVYFDVDLKLMPRLTINGEGRDAMYEDNYHNRSFVAKERVTLKENG